MLIRWGGGGVMMCPGLLKPQQVISGFNTPFTPATSTRCTLDWLSLSPVNYVNVADMVVGWGVSKEIVGVVSLGIYGLHLANISNALATVLGYLFYPRVNDCDKSSHNFLYIFASVFIRKIVALYFSCVSF